MFSGLIAHAGVVADIQGDPQRGMTLLIEAPSALAEGVSPGDSVAVNGVRTITLQQHRAELLQRAAQ